MDIPPAGAASGPTASFPVPEFLQDMDRFPLFEPFNQEDSSLPFRPY